MIRNGRRGRGLTAGAISLIVALSSCGDSDASTDDVQAQFRSVYAAELDDLSASDRTALCEGAGSSTDDELAAIYKAGAEGAFADDPRLGIERGTEIVVEEIRRFCQ